jgi:DNA-binding transcriptional LysR family regulator
MSFTRFTLRQIEAFIAVAELQSFSAAAERLGLTAQAVSQLIGELEAHLGFRLFDRTTRRVALSSAGRDFHPSAQTLMRHVQGTEIVADDVRHQAAGILRIGAPLVLASTAIPEAIKAFQEKRPRVVVRVRDVAVDQLVESVAAGDVDLAVGPDRATTEDVTSQALFDSAWVLWCSPKHKLAKSKRLTWSDIVGEPLVAAGFDHERGVAQMRLSAPEESRVVPLDVVDNITTALGVAAQGRMATLAPAYVGVLALKFGLVMRRVVDPETVRKVCLYKPTARALSPAADAFSDHLAIWLPKWAKRIYNYS